MSKRKKRNKARSMQEFRIDPKTEGQEEYWEALNDDSVKYLAVTGPAGSGKTILAAQRAADGFKSGEFDKIYLCRSLTAIAGEDPGFLKGDLDSKMSPWLAPLTEHLSKFMPDSISEHVSRGDIEFLPLAYVRGRSLDKCFVICTEAQNLTLESFKSILTRMDFRSKCIFDGDWNQNDRQDTLNKQTDFERVCHALINGLESFDWVEMGPEDVVRSRDIIKILELIEPLEA